MLDLGGIALKFDKFQSGRVTINPNLLSLRLYQNSKLPRLPWALIPSRKMFGFVISLLVYFSYFWPTMKLMLLAYVSYRSKWSIVVCYFLGVLHWMCLWDQAALTTEWGAFPQLYTVCKYGRNADEAVSINYSLEWLQARLKYFQLNPG